MSQQHEYDWFMEQFYKLTGINLLEYKRPQMERRLTSLRDRRGFSTFEAYMKAVSINKELLAELLDRMTINVSEFYRNEARWDVLAQKILPKIQRQSGLKVWSAACSTGEEPYTILMVLSEIISLNNISLLATDIDDLALAAAKTGEYSRDLLKPVPQEFIKKYFSSSPGDRFVVSDSLRNRITFKKHNLLRDSYPIEQDLIVCRNVLIYFTDEAKQQVYQKFARALRPGGVLFVGSTEQIFHSEALGFKQIEPFFYQKM